MIRPMIRPMIRSMIGDEKAFTPADITTLGWYDPSNTSTITSAANLVSQIDDIGSSGSEHLVQGTVSKQMSTGLQTMNGLNVLSSTVASKLMQNLTFPVPVSGNLTISFVARIDGQTTSTSTALISMDATKDWQLMSANTAQFNGALNTAGLGSYDTLSGGPFTGPDIWTLVFDFDNSIKKIFVNGIERSSGSYNTVMDSVQKLRIFANRGGANPVFGLFGEMVITEDVSEETRSNLQGYLSNKWGVAI